MATSGVDSFSQNRDDIITEALQLCGVIADGESPTSAQLTSCARTLNMLIKAWQADGMQLFRRKKYTLSASTNESYDMPHADMSNEIPTRISHVYRRDSDGIDIPLEPISYQEYVSLSDKDSASVPTSFNYQYNGPTAKLYVWPTFQSGATDSLIVIGERPIYDFTGASDDVDFPSYYFLALAYGLALAICAKYGVDAHSIANIKELAMFYKQEALSYDVEEGTSVQLQPRFR